MKEPKPPKAENQDELQKIFAGVVINVLAKMTNVERELFFDRLRGKYCLECGGDEKPCFACRDISDYD